MKTKINIDSLISETVKSDGLISPPGDFEEKVMSSLPEQILHENVYKPLLSPRALWGILGAAMIIIALLLLMPANRPRTFLNISFVEKIQLLLAGIDFNFEIGSISTYIISSALLMLLLQAILIGRYFKRIWR